MGPSAGLDGLKISPPTEIRSPDRPARSQSLIPTELPGPQQCLVFDRRIKGMFPAAEFQRFPS